LLDARTALALPTLKLLLAIHRGEVVREVAWKTPGARVHGISLYTTIRSYSSCVHTVHTGSAVKLAKSSIGVWSRSATGRHCSFPGKKHGSSCSRTNEGRLPRRGFAVVIAEGQIQITEDIDFDTDSAAIGKDSKDVLREVAKTLTDHAEIKYVRVEGHTDNVGDAAHNKDLSQRRADAVVKWLVAHGIDDSRLTSVGVGDARPLVPNDTEEKRHRNRRVEFHIENRRGTGIK